MQTSSIKNIKYKDSLARQRRNKFFLKVSLISLAAVIIVGALIYFLFFTPTFEIKTIKTQDLGVNEDIILSKVNAQIAEKSLHYLAIQRNILFFGASALAAEIRSSLPVLSELTIIKEYPNTILVTAKERQPIGIWCFGNNNCKYFDDSGVTWGNAAPSSGFLLITIIDQRDGASEIDTKFLYAAKKIYQSLMGSETAIKQIIIPGDSVDEFNAITAKGYPIFFSLGTDLDILLNSLKIFLKEKTKNPAFMPQYLDLRIEGRVYFK